MDPIDGRRVQGQETRRRILEAAREEFAEKGTRVTLQAIAARVRLTKQAVLHHFPSKQRILMELTLETVSRDAASAVAFIGKAKGAEAVERFVRGLVGLHHSDPEGFKLIYLYPQARRIPVVGSTMRSERVICTREYGRRTTPSRRPLGEEDGCRRAHRRSRSPSLHIAWPLALRACMRSASRSATP